MGGAVGNFGCGMGQMRGGKTGKSPPRLMTLRDFYDCFLSYEKSYEPAHSPCVCVFLFLSLLHRLLSFFLFGKFMKFYLLPKQFAPFTFFISPDRVREWRDQKKFCSLTAFVPKEFRHRMQVT